MLRNTVQSKKLEFWPVLQLTLDWLWLEIRQLMRVKTYFLRSQNFHLKT